MRRLSGGEWTLLGLTALFLCVLFFLHGHPGWTAAETEVFITAAENRRPSAPAASGETAPPAGEPDSSSLLNINTASAAELTVLPGIGEVLAGRIVAYRDEHGPFSAPEELKNVSGIGDARFAAIQDLVTCG